MASVVLTSYASALGSSIAPGIGGRLMGAVGGKIGKRLDQALGITAVSEGARLENLRVSDSRYGIGVPLAFGQTRVAGNVIWASDLMETKHEASVFGGKGGVVSGSSSSTTYSYSLHCAIAIAEGPIGGVLTIWADTKVIYQNGVWKDGLVGNATFYKGTQTQPVDPVMQNYCGVGAVPAYRGLAYVVLQDLQLKSFGNRLPSLTFEILPADVTLQPTWMGALDQGLRAQVRSATLGGMVPIVLAGNEVRRRRVMLGGYDGSGAATVLRLVEVDVSGSTPVETVRRSSPVFTAGSVGYMGWALDPEGRFVAWVCGMTGGVSSHIVVIYDTETAQFGSFLNVQMVQEYKQVVWLDPQHFAVPDASGGRRGLRVFARSGLAVVDLGFFDVWGPGSGSVRILLFYVQFTPCAGGILYYTADTAPFFSEINVRPVFWQDGALTVGAVYNLIKNCDVGNGSGPVARLMQTGTDEWTLFYGSVLDWRLLSFSPGTGSAVITRPWQIIPRTQQAYYDCAAPLVYGDRIVIVSANGDGYFYYLSEIALRDGSFEVLTQTMQIQNVPESCSYIGLARVDGTRLMLVGGWSPDYMNQVAMIKRCQAGVSMAALVGALLTRAGYGAGDFDVGALSDVQIDGYVLDEPVTAAKALEPLQIYQPFDVVETGTLLKAVPHRNAAQVTLEPGEVGAVVRNEKTQQGEALVEIGRQQELDLPLEVTIDYLDASRDYEIGTQRARRLATRGARHAAKITLPMVCAAAKAKQIAEARLFTAWAEREEIGFALSRRYLFLEPGDVVAMEDGTLVRLKRVVLTDGVMKLSGVVVPELVVESSASAEAGVAVVADVARIVPSRLALMDLPLLRAQDDQPGLYAAVSGAQGWRGASLWRSADGVDYESQADFKTAATMGIATSVLGNAVPHYMDCAQSVTVQLLQGSLESCALAALLNGANAALVGDEILQFQTAVLVGPGLYQLSGLLRGRRGTEDACATHVMGERFVLLSKEALVFMPAALVERNRSFVFRALSYGQSLGDAWDVPVVYGMRGLKPLAPVQVKGYRAAGVGGDLAISWIRRARLNAQWVDYVDVPLDEASELYDVEILDGAVVKRTFAGVGSTGVIYSASQQTVDWGASVPAVVSVAVYQISARFGRGAKALAQI